MERISRNRAIIIGIFMAVILGLFAVKLYKLQLVDVEDTDNTLKFVTQTRVKASRGDLLDRNGIVLVGNRASYDLVFNHFVIISSDDTNESLYRLIQKCWDLDIDYNDHFPVTTERPYEYTLEDYTSAWQSYFQLYLENEDIDSDITAPLLMEKLRDVYEIPDEWTDAMARAVIGLRYEFDLRGVKNLATYVFIEDVSDENLSALLELNIPGLMVESSTVRETYTHYAAHILGTMGKMSAEQWATIQESDQADEYYMDAEIGQSGFESAFEEYLHGVDGLRKDTVDKNGTILSQEYYEGQEPQAGNNVETTIDINLQMVAEDALWDVIEYLKDPDSDTSSTDGEDVEGASVVVMMVKTGEVLACASYPTYDPTTYNEDYEEILEEDFDPLYNRALMGTYYPGSTYKMCALVAAMRAGVYEYGEEIVDEGVFTKYDGFSPKCLLYSNRRATHGSITSTKALEVSCNYFFYELGWRMTEIYGGGSVTKGNAILDETAKNFGLGEKTGVELSEATGYRANAESKAATHTGQEKTFYKGDQVQACIGQSTNMVTPIQQAVYMSTLANEGTRMKATFLSRVVSADYTTLVYENEPEIVSTMELTSDIVKAYKEGMIAVVEGSQGTARNTLAGLSVQICGKTGTAQTGRLGSDDGYFVCFAPADDPEIAIAVHGEKAAHGATLARVAKAIIEYYFSADDVGETVTYENSVS